MGFELPPPPSPEKLKSETVIGRAPELEKSKETLKTIEVSNKVIWVNEHFKAPFNLEAGKPAELGIFLYPKAEKLTLQDKMRGWFLKNSDGASTLPIEVALGHGRNALAGRIIFEDDQGKICRDIDLKGIWYVEYRYDTM